ncbi:MAG: peptide chain release factor N(5)-glutamine methyltransferase, partial [Chloroflexi bacterium]|nr:peptide chain release factor N(5)-glutamine methyltransferase [Chloroflexota bacterium]
MSDNIEPGMTDSRTLLTRGRQALVQAGVNEVLLEARLLLAHAMGIESNALLLDPDRVVPASAARAFEVLLARRVAREPLAYITGFREFYGLRLDVDPRALIPRPETELLVDEALAVVRAWAERRRRPITIADVGTGSGAIIVALAVALADTDARFHATDLSAGAIELARANADRHGVGERISFHVG